MIFLHRQNVISDFSNVDGIELDVRSINDKIYLNHDRLQDNTEYILLEDFLGPITLPGEVKLENPSTTNLQIDMRFRFKNIYQAPNNSSFQIPRKFVWNLKVKVGNYYLIREIDLSNATPNEFEFEVPKDVRAESVRDLVKNYKTAFTNLKRNNIQKFNFSLFE